MTEAERLNEFIRHTEKYRKASREMFDQQIPEPGPRKASEWHRLEEERAKAQATHEEEARKVAERVAKAHSWQKIPVEKLQEIDAKMDVFRGDLIADKQTIGWDPNKFRVYKMSETEGILVLESRGETK